MSPLDLLIVGAFPPEIAPLAARLGPLLSGEIGGRSVGAEAVGIGLVESAIGTAVALSLSPARAVVFIGSCGAFASSSVVIGDIVSASFTCLADGASSERRAEFPALLPTVRLCDAGLARGLLMGGGAAPVGVATVPAVTNDLSLGNSIARATKCSVEHLEAFGVASACAHHNVPFGALLGVTNQVGPNGSAEWRANHISVAEAVTARLLAWLDGGAAGAPL